MNQPLFPEALTGKPYSFRADLKLSAWAVAAVLLAMLARWLLQEHPDWGVPLRAAVALSPLLPSLLWVRSLARWIGGMDELQKRIQLEACLFTVVGTLFAATAISLLNSHGIHLPRLREGLGWEGTFVCVVVLYIARNFGLNRHYR